MQNSKTDFNRVRDGRNSMPLYYDVDLSAARSITAGTALVINIAGNSFFCDQDVSVGGVATVHFQDTSYGRASAPFTVTAGFIAQVPFTQLLVENSAQSGKRMRIFYGVDLDFIPGSGGVVSLNGAVSVSPGSTVTEANTVLTAGVAAVVAPAASSRKLLMLRNGGAGPVYIGASTVTANSPLRIDPGMTYLFEAGAGPAFYGLSPGGGTIYRMEVA